MSIHSIDIDEVHLTNAENLIGSLRGGGVCYGEIYATALGMLYVLARLTPRPGEMLSNGICALAQFAPSDKRDAVIRAVLDVLADEMEKAAAKK